MSEQGDGLYELVWIVEGRHILGIYQGGGDGPTILIIWYEKSSAGTDQNMIGSKYCRLSEPQECCFCAPVRLEEYSSRVAIAAETECVRWLNTSALVHEPVKPQEVKFVRPSLKSMNNP